MKGAGIALMAIGGVLTAIGVIWGSVIGYYPSELPVLIPILLLGAGGLWLGQRLYANAPETPAPRALPPSVANAFATPPTPYSAATTTAAAGVPAAAPITPAAPQITTDEIGPDTTAGRLSALASNPELWPQIEAHPNTYPALREWIKAQRDSAASDGSRASARVSDPTTSPSELAELAQSHPELRSAIAAHPNAYPALREWIEKNGAE